jgi:hypothetical protein
VCHQLQAHGLLSIAVRRYVRNTIQTSILAFALLVLLLFLGAELEGYFVRQSAGTLGFYQQTQVCGVVLVVASSSSSPCSSSSSSREPPQEIDNDTTTTTTGDGGSHQHAKNNSQDCTFPNSTTRTTTTTTTTTTDDPPLPLLVQQNNNTNTNNTNIINASNINTNNITNHNSTMMTGVTIATYESRDAVEQAGGFVGHCGPCGACSNPHDLLLYDTTKNTLFAATTTCAKRALIWGRVTARHCLEHAVGFTDPCNDCWVENILCDLRKCVFTCLLYGLFGDVDGGSGSTSGNNSSNSGDNSGGDSDPKNGGGGTTLNACTECDERRCGPAFIVCAGANRRRSGIVSDIARNEATEVCQSVRDGWWDDPALQQEWQRNGSAGGGTGGGG